MGKKIDLTGRIFGRLTVLYEQIERVNKQILWVCKCECGNITVVYGNDLNRGKTTSCGCFKIENQTTHGQLVRDNLDKTLYRTWYHMIERCYNPTNISYKYYGEKGVKVCDRWLNSVTDFISDMGDRPKGYTLDRIDNDGDYTRENCKWSNSETQCNNRRSNKFITFNGETLSQSQWSKKLFGNTYTIKNRLYCGWSIERILTTPNK